MDVLSCFMELFNSSWTNENARVQFIHCCVGAPWVIWVYCSIIYVDTTVFVSLCLFFFYISFICSSGHWSLACLGGLLRNLGARFQRTHFLPYSSEHFPVPTRFQRTHFLPDSSEHFLVPTRFHRTHFLLISGKWERELPCQTSLHNQF